MQVVVPVLAKCKEIESCLDCSAKNLIFVSEVFYYAVKAVVHPVAPLFDVHANNGAGALRPLCIKALHRIFAMCDTDKARALASACSRALCYPCKSKVVILVWKRSHSNLADAPRLKVKPLAEM